MVDLLDQARKLPPDRGAVLVEYLTDLCDHHQTGVTAAMSKTTDTDAPVLTTFRLPRDELDRLRAVATITGRSQTEIIKAAVGTKLNQVIKQRRIGKLVDELVRQQGK